MKDETKFMFCMVLLVSVIPLCMVFGMFGVEMFYAVEAGDVSPFVGWNEFFSLLGVAVVFMIFSLFFTEADGCRK